MTACKLILDPLAPVPAGDLSKDFVQFLISSGVGSGLKQSCAKMSAHQKEDKESSSQTAFHSFFSDKLEKARSNTLGKIARVVHDSNEIPQVPKAYDAVQGAEISNVKAAIYYLNKKIVAISYKGSENPSRVVMFHPDSDCKADSIHDQEEVIDLALCEELRYKDKDFASAFGRFDPDFSESDFMDLRMHLRNPEDKNLQLKVTQIKKRVGPQSFQAFDRIADFVNSAKNKTLMAATPRLLKKYHEACYDHAPERIDPEVWRESTPRTSPSSVNKQ